MPDLNGMSCQIESTPGNQAYPELWTTYGNQRVQCLVCVADNDETFNIHFTTKSFVASGLAIFVWIDGRYQANRNITDIPAPLTHQKCRSENLVDIRLRQKEEADENGRFIIGREWSFRPLRTAPAHEVPHMDKDGISGFGTIEVVILRCHANSSIRPSLATDLQPGPVVPDVPPRTVKAPSSILHDGGSMSSRSRKMIAKVASAQTATPTPSEHGRTSGFLGGFDGVDEGFGRAADNADRAELANHTCITIKPKVLLDGADDDKWCAASGSEINIETYRKQRNAQKAGSGKMSSMAGLTNGGMEGPEAKAYWRDWNPTSKGYSDQAEGVSDTSPKPKDPFSLPAYEQPQIYGAFAASRGLTVQAVTGKGARYLHFQARPTYIDNMDAPFAVFTFLYRTKEYFDQLKVPSKARTSTTRSKIPPSILSNRTPSVRKTVNGWNDGNEAKLASIKSNLAAWGNGMAAQSPAHPAEKEKSRSGRSGRVDGWHDTPKTKNPSEGWGAQQKFQGNQVDEGWGARQADQADQAGVAATGWDDPPKAQKQASDKNHDFW